jgi:thioredoxin 1
LSDSTFNQRQRQQLAIRGFFCPNYWASHISFRLGQTVRPNPTNAHGGKQHMSNGIVNISDDSFEKEVLKADGPVLVDYWAEWCGPCKIIAPVLQEIAQEYKGKLKVAKLNIDENPQTPPKYGIRGIPTLMLFKNGNVEATKVGAVSKSQLAAFIDGNL